MELSASLLPLFFLALSSCSSTEVAPSRYVSVLSFNVEKLFDTEHGSGKWDAKARLNEKLLRLSQVITESTTGCPDILVLQEVENEYVLKKLNSLLSCRYTSLAILDNRDVRGLRVAMLSRFQIKSSQTLFGILDVEFYAEGTSLRVLGLQLPASFSALELRKVALKFVEELFYQKNIATLVAGDWNVSEKENVAEKMLEALRRNFQFSDDVIRATSGDLGTAYDEKDKTWAFLDKIALARNHFDQVECHVMNSIPGQRNDAGHPQSFSLAGVQGLGVSDHFPVLCRAAF